MHAERNLRRVFDKILIANRGEIACRVARTARRLGVRTVAIYSDADAQSMHVSVCDEAFRVGPPPARESYLAIDRIIEIARRSGAQAIHPGYGFLSENPDFAAACTNAGIVFIGPPAQAISAMGSKSEAKRIMSAAGVPVVPGYHEDVQDVERLIAEADAIGYPVLIKASAGGGGKGMRSVDRREDFGAALASAQREAKSAFGDDRVLLEKLLVSPRHIEVQVFADTHGNVVHLFERDCSVQRRHQKVLEEAPAPGLTSTQRKAIGAAAVTAAKSIGYVGAGTVEFIAPRTFLQDGVFYFMEMNTRLQVEHPVTEMITGVDLVEWQLRVAAGERLPLAQQQIAMQGHAIEARLYAEDPERGFLPSVGRLTHWRMPESRDNVRIDTGVREGDVISSHYDPMLAKLIVHAGDRASAVRKMAQALTQCEVAGVSTNIAFLGRILKGAFARGDVDTGLIVRNEAELLAPAGAPADRTLIALGLAEWASLHAQRMRDRSTIQDRFSPWQRTDGWWLNSGSHAIRIDFRDAVSTYRIEMRSRGTSSLDATDAEADSRTWDIVIDDRTPIRARLMKCEPRRVSVALSDGEYAATVVANGDERHVFCAGEDRRLQRVDPLAHAGEHEVPEGHLRAPMSGTIVAVLVEAGERVLRGAPLIVLEAMKMEHTITATADGLVSAVNFRSGDRVQEGADLVDLEVDGI